MPILDMNTMKVESKWHQFKETVKDKAQSTLEWVCNNPEAAGIALTVVTTLVGGGIKIAKGLVRTYNLKQEQYNKDRYIYDRSLGMYLHTKRSLRNKDYIAINNRRKNGEKLSDILQSMNILE